MKGSFVRRGNPAFTLIELLVVVAIIGLLISILLPSLTRARAQAKTAVCASNLHQMVLTSTFYAADNRGRVPFIPGLGPNQCTGPYLQYYQLVRLYPYLGEQLDIYRCPSALDQNSVKSLFGKNNLSPAPAGTTQDVISDRSLYFMRKGDEIYSNFAYQKGYWPQYDPFDIDEEFPEIYTEYFLNDFNPPVCTTPIYDDGRKLANINGGIIESVPGPQYAVLYADWSAYAKSELQRHNQKTNLGFLDGHVELMSRRQYFDEGLTPEVPEVDKLDKDPFGNRPFYKWGAAFR